LGEAGGISGPGFIDLTVFSHKVHHVARQQISKQKTKNKKQRSMGTDSEGEVSFHKRRFTTIGNQLRSDRKGAWVLQREFSCSR
jgi:hypothetical protein